MNTKQVMALLNNIVTNRREVEHGEQIELSFRIEPNAENNALFDSSMMRDYSVDEVADLITTMNPNELSEDEYEMLKILKGRLESDNINGDVFSNEGLLVGPLDQKIIEYDNLVKGEEFSSNLTTLNSLKAKNANLSAVNMHNLKENETDNKYKLDYVTVRKEDGITEVLPITDPDYLKRFEHEHADDIANMTSDEFYNKLKASTESELTFVEMNKYIANPEIRNRMNQPKIQDEQILGFERDEVQNLVNSFIPGRTIEIGIDNLGEVFYRAGDAILKGVEKEGKREIDWVQRPAEIKNYVDDKATDMTNEEVMKQIEVEQTQSIATPEMESNTNYIHNEVELDNNRFIELMDAADPILNGEDEELKSELLDQINAAVKERSEETITTAVQKKITQYYNWRVKDLEMMKSTGNTTSGIPMTSREVAILEEVERIDQSLNPDNMEEEVETTNEIENNEEMNYNPETFGDTSYSVDEFAATQEYVPVQAPREQSQGKVRTLGKHKNNRAHYGLTAVVLLIEIITVALIVMMFLSLDI